MMGILRALTQLLHVWWTKDRIRVARSEGKLLRIQIGDRLLIADKIFEVVDRYESDVTEVVNVIYTLADKQTNSSDLWRLSFTMQSNIAILSDHTDSTEIFCDQVVVLENMGIRQTA